MSKATTWCDGLIPSMAVCAALAHAGAAAQDAPQDSTILAPEGGRHSPARVMLEGFVLAPDGSPAEGAVVVSSAGGRAVTDVAGSYRLEVEVPPMATSVQLTAVSGAGGNLVARASVALSGMTRSSRVEPLSLGSSCSPSWLPTFGGQPGCGPVDALATYDDGNGLSLYVGGYFLAAGSVAANHIAKWNGSSWAALGSGMNDTVLALAVYDDGAGPALYAGGEFTSAGGAPANGIAKWDGTGWSALGSGMDADVTSLAVHDDGGGPALYAGGYFTTAGGVAANRIAKWDGSSWSPLGSGMGGNFASVHALAVYDDGGGPALYAGGTFTTAGGVTANRIAKWDGSSWSALGSGMSDDVRALAVHDDGGGPALYAGGTFTTAGGVTANRVAKWGGSSWSPLGSGVGNSPNTNAVHALGVYDDGGGPALYAGGTFATAGGVAANRIAKWNGSGWSALGSGMPDTNDAVYALAVFDVGGGPALYAGGFNFTTAGGVAANQIAKWNGSSWASLGAGISSIVDALAVFDDGSGPALYAGGNFKGAGGVTVNQIAKWDGATWSALGSGMGGITRNVRALAVYDDGGGPALYAGGYFTTAGGVSARRIAKWDGSSWSPLGSGMTSYVSALAAYDDGGGPALYAGGFFVAAGGVAANRIAKWGGASWSPLGSGMSDEVRALAVYDDGSGPALYAGGLFTTAGGVAANRIAKWNGASWSALGSGMIGGNVLALAVHDDGSGPALYAGGGFTTAGGVTANGIARWDGASWSTLGSGPGFPRSVEALVVHDDGGGPALYAGGTFTSAGGVAANGIAKWDGLSWSPLGSGVTSASAYPYGPDVGALAVYDDGTGPALYAGGGFRIALDSGDSFLARWWRDTTPPTLSCPSSVFVLERFGSSPGEVVNYSATASDANDPDPTVVCAPPSGSVFPVGTTIVTCTATDSCGNESTRQFPVTVASKARR